MRPVMLLIPGMLNTPDIWRDVGHLLEDKAEVRILDVQTQESIADMATDAWTLVADLPQAVPLIVCGFSMGGYVTLEMLAHPQRSISAVGLLDTSARPESPEGRIVREKTIAAIERDFEKVAAGISVFGTAERTHADAALMSSIVAHFKLVGGATAIRQNRAIVDRLDHRAKLAQLDIPTLVMCGREDRITPPEASRELAELIPGARLEWIDDAGHMTPCEQPQRVAALLSTLV